MMGLLVQKVEQFSEFCFIQLFTFPNKSISLSCIFLYSSQLTHYFLDTEPELCGPIKQNVSVQLQYELPLKGRLKCNYLISKSNTTSFYIVKIKQI